MGGSTVVALTRTVSGEFLRRRLAGESLQTVIPPVRAAADQASDLIESGVGAYTVKDPPRPDRPSKP
jgi:hypothetical protein